MRVRQIAKRIGLGLVLVLSAAAIYLRLKGWLLIPYLEFGINVDLSPPDEKLSPSALQQRLQVPEGFRIDYYVRDLPRARFMRFTSEGDLIVTATRGESGVFLVERDADGDGRADGVRRLLAGLDAPHGIDFLDDWLYIAETHRVIRVRFDAKQRSIVGEPEVIVPDLPRGGNHTTRTLRFGPDGWMYVTVGSSCNVCEEADPRRAAMLRYRPDGSDFELFATGLRNTVGFDFRPGTGKIYGTDNGRDLLGDDFPPCEFNQIERGGFYGFPYANGSRIPDPNFGEKAPDKVAQTIPPAYEFSAHTAPLGMTFYRGTAFPDRYRGAAFVAQHGSWNRSRKIGYRVLALAFDAQDQITATDFVTGFEIDDDVMGRPADVAEGPDGALYVTDDFGGAIYRVAYEAQARSRPRRASVAAAFERE